METIGNTNLLARAPSMLAFFCSRPAREWVSDLEGERRQIHAFLLWADYETWQKRLFAEVPEGDFRAHEYYRLFEHHEWKRHACLKLIDTTTSRGRPFIP